MSFRGITLLLLLVFFLTGLQGQTPLPLEQKFEAALGHLQAGNLETARSLLEDCLSSDPSNYKFHHLSGVVAGLLQDWPVAEKAFQEALRLRPDFTPAAFNLALVYKSAGEHRKGIELITGYVSREKIGREVEAEFHELAASLYELANQPVEATSHLYQALALDPTNESYFYSLGSQLLKYLNYPEAEKVFQEGVERFPDSARLHLGLGTAAALKQPPDTDYELAALSFLRGATLAPQDELPYRFLSFLPAFSYATGEISNQMFETLRELARTYPGNAMAQLLFAVSLFQQQRSGGGDFEEARIETLLKRAFDLDPSLSQARFWLGRLYMHAKRYREAVSAFEQAVSSSPSTPIYHYHLGQAYSLSGRRDEGQKELQLFNRLSREQKEEVLNRQRFAPVLRIEK